jgi:ElaB/YqjD/DUF883 family membrane-anchored ribosome-binding protein
LKAEIENLEKAVQTSSLLLDDLHAIHASKNAILSDSVYATFSQTSEIHSRLKKMLEAVKTEASKE